MPPQRETFRHTASATLRGQRAGLAGRLVHRDAHGDAVAHRAQLLDAVDGLLDELQAGGRQRLDAAHGLVDLPGAVGVQAQRRVSAPTAARTAATRPASSPMPTLTFTHE